MEQDSELQFLSNVYRALSKNSEANQRELAAYSNLSLGMTNALLRRFVNKGWLYMNKISKRNIRYMLTPQGIKELAVRSKRYLKNTARLMNEYQSCIRDFVRSAAQGGSKKLILIGDNDLEFLFDYACRFSKLTFTKINSKSFLSNRFFVTDDTLIVFSNENRYKTFLQTDGFSDFEKQCTTVLAILQDVKWQLLA